MSYTFNDEELYDGYGGFLLDETPGGIARGYSPDPVGFGGQWGYYTDPETRLLSLTRRYYDAGAGRFLNRDPLGYGGGINLYGFAGNNPVNEQDPSGLDYVDAERAIAGNKKDIIDVAKVNHIQPELLAGVVYAEVNAGGVPGGNAASRQASIQKFSVGGNGKFFGKGDLGITKFHQFTYDHPDLKTYGQRYAWAESRDADDHLSLVESAGLLAHLARRRYGANSDDLAPDQIAIVLTEYNLGERPIRANPQPNKEGRAYLAGRTAIEILLSHGHAAKRKMNGLNS